MALEVTTATAPAYWASYLVNGDASSLNDEEQAACDAWLESLDGWTVVACEGESYFAHSHDASAFSPLAGDIVEYVLHKVPA